MRCVLITTSVLLLALAGCGGSQNVMPKSVSEILVDAPRGDHEVLQRRITNPDQVKSAIAWFDTLTPHDQHPLGCSNADVDWATFAFNSSNGTPLAFAHTTTVSHNVGCSSITLEIPGRPNQFLIDSANRARFIDRELAALLGRHPRVITLAGPTGTAP